MQVILEPDEAWSIMTLVVSQVLDQVELTDEGKAAVRRWRTERAEGTAEMSDLTVTMNESIGKLLEEQMTRLIRRQGGYVSTREGAESSGRSERPCCLCRVQPGWEPVGDRLREHGGRMGRIDGEAVRRHVPRPRRCLGRRLLHPGWLTDRRRLRQRSGLRLAG